MSDHDLAPRLSQTLPCRQVVGRWTRRRIVAFAALLVSLLGIVGVRAYRLQVREGNRLRSMAEQQYRKQIEVAPRRGVIHDRHGAPLALIHVTDQPELS